MAQSVEQLIRNQQVAGSSPATSSKGIRENSFFYFISLWAFSKSSLTGSC